MTEEPPESVLRRMVRGDKPAPPFGEVSPAKALRLALAKAGQEVLDQVVQGSGLEEIQMNVFELKDALPENAMTMAMDGPGGSLGIIALTRPAVSAITEALTVGRVSSAEVPNRAPTATEALLCRKFLVTVMTVFAARLVGHTAASWATGFVPDDIIRDLRRLPVMMEDIPYRMIRIEADFATGAKVGEICIVVPWEGAQVAPEIPIEEPEDSGESWALALEQNVLPVQSSLEAVLYRLPMDLDQLEDLKVGDTIPVPLSFISSIQLVAANGEVVMSGRLGQAEGMKAIRIANSTFSADTEEEEAPAVESPAFEDPMAGVADALIAGSGLEEELAAEAAMADMASFDDDEENGGEADLADLPDLNDESNEEFPAFDMGDMDIGELDDLEDLPLSID